MFLSIDGWKTDKIKIDNMKLFYIFFFASINLLLFSFMTQKLKLNDRLKAMFAIYILGMIIVHFVNPFGLSIPNKLFFILLGFSTVLIVFYIMPKIVILFNDLQQDELLYKWYEFWMTYVIYTLIFVFQCATIIQN
ncbi:hypothetical protein Y10_22260 [Neptunitalea sp. Y10]|uniref:Uncharacterized protein n=1 Tax=Neptunitalea lumnitzerae TaxID=2965509 RepID=A0ABQ5MKB7_9FLAO|nr:hypothetical protein Y10_22260 [Neptunitalea sp. Y10]